MEAAARQLTAIDWFDDAYQASAGADALVILTEWDDYVGLDLGRLKQLMRGRAFVDLRNVYKPDLVTAAGFEHFSVGRPASLVSEAAQEAAA
jgi:UDPglucose 6-dehydrogenase